MTTTIGNSSSLDTALSEYQTLLNTKIKSARSNSEAEKQNLASIRDQLQNKTCTFLKIEAAKKLYTNINQCIAIAANKNSELIKTSVDDIITKSETLKEQFGEMSKTLKTLKSEVYTVKEQSCNLIDCCLDKDRHDSQEIYNTLCEIPDFEIKLGDIKQKGEIAYNMSDYSFCAVVNVSGIQGFACIESLTDYSEKLVESVSELKKDVEENCKNLASSIGEAIAERSELVEDVVVSKYSSDNAKCDETALCNTWNKSCDKCDESGDHPQAGKTSLNEICGKFKEDIPTDPDDPGKNKIKKKDNGPDF